MLERIIATAKIRGFRNITKQEFFFTREGAVFLGKNGQGKTSALEALFFTLTGELANKGALKDVVQDGKKICAIDATLFDKETEKQTQRNVKIKQDDSGRYHKEILVKGVKKSKENDQNKIPCVYFSPDDLRLFSGPPTRRREFLNQAIIQTNPSYKKTLAAYKRTLKNRNAVLEKGRQTGATNGTLLEVLTERLVDYGAFIWAQTGLFWNDFIVEARESIQNLWYDTRAPQLAYCPNLAYIGTAGTIEEVAQAYRHELKKRTKREQAAGKTTLGPHLDDFAVSCNGRPVKGRASRGETRTLAISLKQALCGFYEKQTDKKTILFLDDVFSELDPEQAAQTIKLTQGRQTFFSTTLLADEVKNIVEKRQISVYLVEAGGFSREQ